LVFPLALFACFVGDRLRAFSAFLIRAYPGNPWSSENLVFIYEIRKSLYRESADYADDTDSTEHMTTDRMSFAF
jgi:hypothetical protein